MKNNLQFGTSGIRSDKMTDEMIIQIANGFAKYLLNINAPKEVFIGYDTREFSKHFANIFGTCLLSYNINPHIFDTSTPTGFVSYVSHKYEIFGVMLTASHNPKEYHGVKFYNIDGKPISDNMAEEIEEYILKCEHISKVLDKPLDTYDVINDMPDYISDICKLTDTPKGGRIKVVYTPLSGTGNKLIDRLLTIDGFEVDKVVNEASCYLNIDTPNPENKENFTEALKLATKYDSDLILATDCDCDRVGCMVKHNYDYVYLTGNELGILLTYYLSEGNMVTTDVSTPLVAMINKNYKFVPVGFKNIMNTDNLTLGFEESGGFLIGNYTYDKDAIGACRVITRMCSYYKDKNLDLVQVLDLIYKKYGKYKSKLFKLKIKLKKPIYKIIKLGKSKIIIRSSGTEPLTKIYFHKYSKLF